MESIQAHGQYSQSLGIVGNNAGQGEGGTPGHVKALSQSSPGACPVSQSDAHGSASSSVSAAYTVREGLEPFVGRPFVPNQHITGSVNLIPQPSRISQGICIRQSSETLDLSAQLLNPTDPKEFAAFFQQDESSGSTVPHVQQPPTAHGGHKNMHSHKLLNSERVSVIYR